MYINLITIDLCPGQTSGGITPAGTLTISKNGMYNVYPYSSASVDVHPSVSLSETYLSNGSYTITGEFNGGMVTVNVPSPQFVTESLSVSANGTYTPGQGIDGYSQVVVDVPAPQFVTETLNVSANGTYNPGDGIDGYSQVVVDVPASGWDQKSLTEGTNKIINLDNSASFVASEAFKGNANIQTVNLPYATSVGSFAFQSCTSLTQVSLPVCSYIGRAAFQNCTSLTQVSLPVCSYIDRDAFQNCTSLTQVSLPVCSYIGMAAFQYCYSLSEVSLPVCSYIGFYAFHNCSSLSIIKLGYSSVCDLYNSAAFQGTPIKSGTGSIYVPASLVDAYKSASNWSYFSTQIFPIE